MIAVGLCALAMLDGAFSGFRAYAGRDGRIAKTPHKVGAARLGAASSLIPLAILAAVLGALMIAGVASYDELTAAGTRMILVYLGFAVVIGLGFLAYFAPAADLQGMGTVVVLGPGTFFRPLLILGGAIYAGVGASLAVKFAAMLAAVLMIGLEYPLNRMFARRYAEHPYSLAGSPDRPT